MSKVSTVSIANDLGIDNHDVLEAATKLFILVPPGSETLSQDEAKKIISYLKEKKV